LAGFGKNGRISDLPEPEPKFGVTLLTVNKNVCLGTARARILNAGYAFCYPINNLKVLKGLRAYKECNEKHKMEELRIS